jgi:hypothetical protein
MVDTQGVSAKSMFEGKLMVESSMVEIISEKDRGADAIGDDFVAGNCVTRLCSV